MEEKHSEEVIKFKFDEVASIIEKGDSHELSRIFDSGQLDDINKPKLFLGPTILTIACESGFIDCVKVLLDHKADLNHINQRESILTSACASGSVEMVRFVIANGLEINDRIILMRVFQTVDILVNTEVVTILIEYINDINCYEHGTFVYWASRAGNVIIVRALLERGADLNKIHGTYDDALFVAAREGHIEVIKLLLTWVAINQPISQARLMNALKQASSYGHVDIVQYLLERWMDTGAINVAIRDAVRWRRLKVVEYLIDRYAQHISPIMGDPSLLSSACIKVNGNILRILLAHGADPNAADSRGELPLQATLDHPDIVKLMLEAGADPNAYFTDGSTALLNVFTNYDQACDVLPLLLLHGADPNLAHADTGYTALMIAASAVRVDLVKVLLEHGADVTQVNHAGISVLDMLGDAPMYSEVVELCQQYMRPILK